MYRKTRYFNVGNLKTIFFNCTDFFMQRVFHEVATE